MNDFKAGDIGYILASSASAVCGDGLYQVRILDIKDKGLCTLMCIYHDVLTGETFSGDLCAVYPTKESAIDEMIARLEIARNE